LGEIMKVILIADEDEKIRNLVRFAFSGDIGYRVESATTGDEALSKSKVIKPDIVIADVTLSNKNGFEVSREIKNDPSLKGTYIILLSPSSTFDNTKVKEALADDVIVKSLDLTNIIGDITEKLEALSSAGRRRRISPLVISSPLLGLPRKGQGRPFRFGQEPLQTRYICGAR